MTHIKPTVLVTETEYEKGRSCFSGETALEFRPVPAAEAELARAIRDARARFVVVSGRAYTGPLYEALPAGALIARFGVGHDGIDKIQATARRVLCTNTPGVLDASVAEHTMLLIAAAARRLPAALSSMAGGDWNPPPGRDLAGKTLAVIGCGGIGRAVARIAALGFGMRVVGCTRPDRPAPETLDHFERVTNDFAAAVSDADFVSLHMPLSPETIGFINRDRLAQISQRAWLINTARGGVVDEPALTDALKNGRLAGAALDVFAREPYAPAEGSADLRALPNVIATPHVGSNTAEANFRMAERVLQNIRFAQAGQFDRMDLINRAVLSELR